MDQKNGQRANADWVIRSVQPGGIERIEAWFGSHGYDPHRHDTYSIGRTLAGVQSFHYAGSLRHGIPGNTLVLHPDELHDGMAGTDAGFRYRMAYVDPALIQNVLGGEPLPFIAGDFRAIRVCSVPAKHSCKRWIIHWKHWRNRTRCMTWRWRCVRSAASRAGASVWIIAQPSAPEHSSWNICTHAFRWRCWNMPVGANAGACHATSEHFTVRALTDLSPCAVWIGSAHWC